MGTREAKQKEAEEMLDRARTALAEAHAAAASAVAEFLETAPRTPEGLVRDTCGGASVVVYKPSYRLRTALQELGEIERGHNGAWGVSNFSRHVAGAAAQSITAHERACQAAKEVLVRHLAGQGEFYAKSYVD